MSKVNALFQDAEEAKFDRQTEIMVDADVEMMFHCGKIESFRINNIPCTWVWDDTSRDAAEYWAALDHISENYMFDWFTVKSWSGSPVKKGEH